MTIDFEALKKADATYIKASVKGAVLPYIFVLLGTSVALALLAVFGNASYSLPIPGLSALSLLAGIAVTMHVILKRPELLRSEDYELRRMALLFRGDETLPKLTDEAVEKLQTRHREAMTTSQERDQP